MHPEDPGSLGIVPVCLLNRLLDKFLLRLPDAVVECRNQLPEDEVSSRIESGRSSGWINSVEPNTTCTPALNDPPFATPRAIKWRNSH